MNMNQAIIEQCADNTKSLLNANWDRIESFRNDDSNSRLTIAVEHKLSFRDNEQMVQTKIGFGKRCSDAMESVVNPDQMQMFGNGHTAPPGDSTDVPIETKPRGRKRAKVADSEPVEA